MTSALIAAAALAVVVQDQVPLRAAPRDAAAQQAVLVQGDLLEVRGEKLGHLQVWDHRRERAGYVRAAQVRRLSLAEADAPQLQAVWRFLRDTPGSEALGIAYVAAWLKAAPAQAIDAEPFDALGAMAERLARRASTRQGAASETVAAHLEAVAGYGVRFQSYERDGALRLCYDGEAFRRVLAQPQATAAQRAQAALALTRPDCSDPQAHPQARQQANRAAAELLDRIDGSDLAALPDILRQRVQVRRAGVWAALTFDRAHSADDARPAAQRALDELAAVARQDLADDDTPEYTDAVLRVGAVRWALAAPESTQARLAVQTRPGEPGQTCVQLVDRRAPTAVLAERCSFGVVWTASARPAPDGRALALAVQPLPAWTELWVFRAGAAGWTVDVLPPGSSDPTLGYVEFAGWVPGAAPKLLLAREARVDGRARRSFEVLGLTSLAVEKQAGSPSLLAAFARWQDAQWRQTTVSLR